MLGIWLFGLTPPLRWEQLGVLLLAAGLAPSVFAGSLYYYNGDSQQRITPEPTQIAEFAPYGATSAARSASPTKAWKFVTLRAAGPGTADAAGGAKTSPEFREGDSPAGRLMALPGGAIVQFKPDWTDTQVHRRTGGKKPSPDKAPSLATALIGGP